MSWSCMPLCITFVNDSLVPPRLLMIISSSCPSIGPFSLNQLASMVLNTIDPQSAPCSKLVSTDLADSVPFMMLDVTLFVEVGVVIAPRMTVTVTVTDSLTI